MGELQLREEPRQPFLYYCCVVATGLLAECAGQPGFSDTARPGDQLVPLVFDPAARGQFLKEGLVQMTW